MVISNHMELIQHGDAKLADRAFLYGNIDERVGLAGH